jgi:hypothetical protein
MPITGKIGELISITGSSLSIVTDVFFQNQRATFETIDDSSLSIRVPAGAAYGKITLVSRLSEPPVSGETTDFFSPYPVINYLDYYTGYFQKTINLYGDALTQVSGVFLNDLACSFSSVDNNNLTFDVPSGNVRGKLKVIGQNELITESNFNFIPVVEITGFYPTNPRTGEELRISGKYFLNDLSLSGHTGYFPVQFNGENATGLFGIVQYFLLTGIIPTGAISGEVKVIL